MKPGQIIENYQGRFAKVVEIKGSRFGLSAWVYKKEAAELETQTVSYLNSFGLSQVMKGGKNAPVIDEPKAPKAEKPAKEPKAPKAE